jgi:hypothetical protein
VKRFGFILIAGFLIVGCSQNKENKEPNLAPANVEKSLKTSASHQIKLEKSSLGKAFLLRASLKMMTSAPSWSDQKPLVVVFEMYGDKLALFEIDTLATYKVIDSNKLISTFEVTSETETEIQFDWGTGLKALVKAPYANPIDPAAIERDREGATPSFEIISSVVKSAGFKENELRVRQASRIRQASLRAKTKLEQEMKPDEKNQPVLETEEGAIEVDYALSPYIPNPEFKKKEADPLDRIGFFVTNLGKDGSKSEHQKLIMHWDVSEKRGPITFALSKHIPKEFKQSVKEGILYWNKVLGRDALRIQEDFDPESALPARTVVIHWLPWTDAGMAWASMQSDPFTGEILRGQVYMTSFFGKLGEGFPQKSAATAAISPAGMSSAITCVYPTEGLTKIAGASKDNFAQFAEDQIRSVLAHEVGHTLGLRHNFAASTQSSLNFAQTDLQKSNYVADGKHPGAEIATSVMDYINGLDEGLLGRWIQKNALKYDRFALSWAASEDTDFNTDLQYCSDEHILSAGLEKKTLYGCQRYDVSGNPFGLRAAEIKPRMASIVQSKFESIVDRIFPAGTDKVVNVDTVLFADKKMGGTSLNSISSGLTLYKGFAPLDKLFVKTGGPNVSTLVHFTEVVGMPWDGQAVNLSQLIATHLTEVKPGDLLRNVIPLKPNGDYDAEFAQRQFDQLKASEMFSKGKTSSGREYVLSDYQKSKIEKYLKLGVDSFNSEVFTTLGMTLGTFKDREATPANAPAYKESKQYMSNIGEDKWGPDLQSILASLIMAKMGTKKIQVNKKDLEVSTRIDSFSRTSLLEGFPASLKPGAVNSLRQAVFKDLLLVYAELKPDTDKFSTTTKTEEQKTFLYKALSEQKISSEAVTWAAEQLSFLEALNNASN